MTIKSVKLRCFQSHEKTFLKLHNRLNVICGKTDSGKSGLRRAIEWTINNRPSGESFKSKWGGETKVELLVKNKNVKTSVTRKKGKENLYILDGKKYRAFGQDVPGDIKNALRMSDINIQSQISLPFMLTMSAGETSRYLNEIVNLEDIDRSLLNIQSTLRRETNLLEEKRINKTQYISDLQSYIWIEEVDKNLSCLEEEEKKIERLKEQDWQIQDIVEKIEVEQKQLDKLSKINVTQAQNSLNRIEWRLKEIELDNKQIEQIKNIISDITFEETQFKDLKIINEQDIKEFKELMPDTCPLCDQEIK